MLLDEWIPQTLHSPELYFIKSRQELSIHVLCRGGRLVRPERSESQRLRYFAPFVVPKPFHCALLRATPDEGVRGYKSLCGGGRLVRPERSESECLRLWESRNSRSLESGIRPPRRGSEGPVTRSCGGIVTPGSENAVRRITLNRASRKERSGRSIGLLQNLTAVGMFQHSAE